jgi:metal-sulfur cluster biosynthetic enzyme
MTDKKVLIQEIEEQIQTVYDPDFPLIDIWTMGLIYDIKPDMQNDGVDITMTYTTPACPSGETMKEMMINAIQERFPDFMVNIDVTFEPMRTIDMIKDEDLKRMFE